jgi:ubiquinone/menaquinone biosynthesis C-methylase UbiE
MPSASASPDFHAFEQRGWEQAASHYSISFAGLTAQTAGPLLDATGVREGSRVLDGACGPGHVAAAAAQRGASVIGVDFAEAMVRTASGRHVGLDFRVADAAQLPFPDASFDAVVMNFGLLHLARPERAISEAHRVLRSGGRFAFTVWAKPEEAVGFGVVLRAIEKHGTMNVGLPAGPPFFQFTDEAEAAQALLRGGFSQPSFQKLSLVWHLASAEEFWRAFSEGTVRTAGLLRAQTPDALAAIREAVFTALRQYEDKGGLVLPMPAVLASAVKR